MAAGFSGCGRGHFGLSGTGLSGGAGRKQAAGGTRRPGAGGMAAHRQNGLPPVACGVRRASLWAVFTGEMGLDGVEPVPVQLCRTVLVSCVGDGGGNGAVPVLVPAARTEEWTAAQVADSGSGCGADGWCGGDGLGLACDGPGISGTCCRRTHPKSAFETGVAAGGFADVRRGGFRTGRTGRSGAGQVS